MDIIHLEKDATNREIVTAINKNMIDLKELKDFKDTITRELNKHENKQLKSMHDMEDRLVSTITESAEKTSQAFLTQMRESEEKQNKVIDMVVSDVSNIKEELLALKHKNANALWAYVQKIKHMILNEVAVKLVFFLTCGSLISYIGYTIYLIITRG